MIWGFDPRDPKASIYLYDRFVVRLRKSLSQARIIPHINSKTPVDPQAKNTTLTIPHHATCNPQNSGRPICKFDQSRSPASCHLQTPKLPSKRNQIQSLLASGSALKGRPLRVTDKGRKLHIQQFFLRGTPKPSIMPNAKPKIAVVAQSTSSALSRRTCRQLRSPFPYHLPWRTSD